MECPLRILKLCMAGTCTLQPHSAFPCNPRRGFSATSLQRLGTAMVWQPNKYRHEDVIVHPLLAMRGWTADLAICSGCCLEVSRRNWVNRGGCFLVFRDRTATHENRWLDS